MYKGIIITIFLGFLIIRCSAQTGGSSVYKFLTLPASARSASLGGTVVSIKDQDLTLAYHNPALLNPAMTSNLTFSVVDLYAGVHYGYAAYAHNYKNHTFHGGIHFMKYGSFEYADVYGIRNAGNFSAAEYNFNLGWAKPLDSSFTIGVNVKTIYSLLESYTSVGLATDIGLTYFSPDRSFCAGLVAKNTGRQITTYIPDNREPLPFDLQLGVSKKLKHVPFRFTFTATNLTKYDLTGESEQIAQGLITDKDSTFMLKVYDHADKIARHLIVGGEFLFTKNFFLNIGYNYLRRKEVGVSSKMSTIGFSWGFGMRISKFNISYGRATYHLAGGSNHLTFTTRLSDFYKKKNN